MSLGGARGIVRVSQNPSCEIQTAMVVEAASRHARRRLGERDLYRLVTGRDYVGEYGEREAARQRGAAFERNLVQNDAALLRHAVAPLYGLDPNLMTVRNLVDEAPGALHAVRLAKMRRLLRDLASGLSVPDLLIQPQLRLKTGPALLDYVHISPDFAVFDQAAKIYVPGEIKSFIVRGDAADRGDLERTRRQAAVEIVALREEALRAGLQDRVANRAAFVFATPFGLRPCSGHQETLDGYVRDVTRAVDVIAKARAKLSNMKAVDDARFEVLIDELLPNYQEKCFGTCIMVDYCKARCAGRACTLGDSAADQLGASTDVFDLTAMINNGTPANPNDAQVASELADAMRTLGYDPRTMRRIA